MPESQFRFYVNTTDACTITDKALQDCHGELANQDSDLISLKDMIFFAVGVVLGAKLSKL
jgi:hypothetical protein